MSDRALLKVNNLSVSFKTNDGIVDAVKKVNFTLKSMKPWPLLVNQVLVNLSLLTHWCVYFQTTPLLIRSLKLSLKASLFSKNQSVKCGDRFVATESAWSFKSRWHLWTHTCASAFGRSHYVPAVKCQSLRAKRRVIELFNLVHLPMPEKSYTKYPHEFSGGQLQRITDRNGAD